MFFVHASRGENRRPSTFITERTVRDGEKSELKRDSSSQSGNGIAQMQMLTADNLKGIASVEVRWAQSTTTANDTANSNNRDQDCPFNHLERDVASV